MSMARLAPDDDGRVFFNEASGATMAADIAMCKRVSETLEQHYPGHPWCVGADHGNGTVVIRLQYPRYDNKPWGYVIHIEALKTDPGMKRVMQAGGEWLERWNLDRRGFRDGDREDAVLSGLDRT